MKENYDNLSPVDMLKEVLQGKENDRHFCATQKRETLLSLRNKRREAEMVNTNILFLRVSKHMKHKLIKMRGEINRCKIIVGDVNTPLSVIDRTNRK